jgi:hypothetical protein
MLIVATSKPSAVLAVIVQFLPSRNFGGTEENPVHAASRSTSPISAVGGPDPEPMQTKGT